MAAVITLNLPRGKYTLNALRDTFRRLNPHTVERLELRCKRCGKKKGSEDSSVLHTGLCRWCRNHVV